MIDLLVLWQLLIVPCAVEADIVGIQEPMLLCLGLANTPREREKGLMWRKRLDWIEGMLFEFPDDGAHSFWMKNTLIPLDMLFISSDHRVVGLVRSAEPGNLRPVGGEFISRYVIELKGGFCDKYGVHPGQSVNWAKAATDR